jgi:hypothetical protein
VSATQSNQERELTLICNGLRRVNRRRKRCIDSAAFVRRIKGVVEHGTYSPLPQIYCPTDVTTGSGDALIAGRVRNFAQSASKERWLVILENGRILLLARAGRATAHSHRAIFGIRRNTEQDTTIFTQFRKSLAIPIATLRISVNSVHNISSKWYELLSFQDFRSLGVSSRRERTNEDRAQ